MNLERQNEEPFFITEEVEAKLLAAGYEFKPPSHIRTKSIIDLYGHSREKHYRRPWSRHLGTRRCRLEDKDIRGPNRDQEEVYLRQVHWSTAITVSDCETMRDGFGHCSELLHSAAATLNHPPPRPEALTAEIDTLATWADSLRQRQSAARLP